MNAWDERDGERFDARLEAAYRVGLMVNALVWAGAGERASPCLWVVILFTVIELLWALGKSARGLRVLSLVAWPYRVAPELWIMGAMLWKGVWILAACRAAILLLTEGKGREG